MSTLESICIILLQQTSEITLIAGSHEGDCGVLERGEEDEEGMRRMRVG